MGAHAQQAKARQRKARREAIDLPLLDYAQFPDLLRAARCLDVVGLTDTEIGRLNDIRKRAAHSGDVVVDNRDSCARIVEALRLARNVTAKIGHRRRR